MAPAMTGIDARHGDGRGRGQIAWLYRELPRLVELGVLTPEAAEALRRHYGTPQERIPGRWGQILLAAFGALLVGGGIILILAHNWDALGRPARAAIALAILLTAQALTMFAVVRRAGSAAWTEAAPAFLVAAVGSTIALVGQTYHVGGSFEGLMRAWLWLVLPIPYLTGSRLAAAGYWGLLAVRAGALPRDAPADPWLLVLLAIPFVARRLRREPDSWASSLLAIAAAASIFVVGTRLALTPGWNGLWAVFQVSFLAALVAAVADSESSGSDGWRSRLIGPAWLVLIVLGTVLSFDDPWRHAGGSSIDLRNPNVVATAFVALACAAYASVGTMRLYRAGQRAAAATTSAAALVIVMHVLARAGAAGAGWIAFNVWLLAAGSLTLVEGMRLLSLGTANRGLVAIAAFLLARFFDTDLSFLFRGLAFLALGIGCLALNFVLMRRRRERLT